jgi:glycosyltransferase involved in cell wall biosynthesis
MLSIIIPVFNQFKYTKKIIEQILDESKDYEIIVVDD